MGILRKLRMKIICYFDPFGKLAHDYSGQKHSGKYGHYCAEWDGLYICSDCGEFTACNCIEEDCRHIKERLNKEMEQFDCTEVPF